MGTISVLAVVNKETGEIRHCTSSKYPISAKRWYTELNNAAKRELYEIQEFIPSGVCLTHIPSKGCKRW